MPVIVRTVNQTPPAVTVTVTTTSLPAGVVGTTYPSTQLYASGGQHPYTWTVADLPVGLQAGSNGIIFGTPTTAGTTAVSVTARDANLVASATVILQLTVTAVVANVVVTSTTLPAATVGLAYNAQLHATGGTGAFSWTTSGTLGWASVSSSGVVTGNPAATGTLLLTVIATDTNSLASAPTQVAIQVQAAGAAVRVTTSYLSFPSVTGDFYAGTAIPAPGIQLDATGGTPPYTWTYLNTVSGVTAPGGGIPPGLSLNSAGQVTGTPTANGFNLTVGDRWQTGIITVQATDSLGVASPLHRVHFGPCMPGFPNGIIQVTTYPPFPQGQIGVPYLGGAGLQLTASGGTPYVGNASYPSGYSWTSTSPPSGLSVTPAGVLGGTPTAASGHVYPEGAAFFVQAKDSTGLVSFNQQVFIPIVAAPIIQLYPNPPTPATVGVPYTGNLRVYGGTPPYTFTAMPGLPQGLTFAADGTISGIPTQSGTFRIGCALHDSSPTPVNFTANWTTSFTVLSAVQDWTQPTGAVFYATTPLMPVPPNCVGITGAIDMVWSTGFLHMHPYDGGYSAGPYSVNGNNFYIGFVQTVNNVNCRAMDIARSYLAPGVTDARIQGQQVSPNQIPLSLKWQVGTAPGQYRIWLGWSASIPIGTQIAPGFAYTGSALATGSSTTPGNRSYHIGSGAQYTLRIRDSNGIIATVMAPNNGYTFVGTALNRGIVTCDAASNAYTSDTAWAAADPHGGVSIVVNTTDTSNGQGGPILYFDVNCTSSARWWAAIINYVCVQYLGPASPINVTTVQLPQQRATVPMSVQLTASGGTSYTWAKVGSTPTWLSVSTGGLVTGTPPSGVDVTSFTVTASEGPHTSAPQTIPISIKLAPSTTAPQRCFAGAQTGTTVVGGCWPPGTGFPPAVDGEPDEFWVYRDGTLIQTGIKPIIAGYGAWATLQIFFADRDLPHGVMHHYDMTAVSAGIESPHSQQITMQTGAGGVTVGVPPTPPTAPLDPATWMPAPFQYNAASGTTWTATQLQDTGFAAGLPGPNSATPWIGCSLQYALMNCQPGDTIVCTAGATYTSSASIAMYQLPVFPSGTTALVNVISSEEPTYKAGGALIPYAAGTGGPRLTPLAITGLVPAGTMTAILAPNQPGLTDASGNWLPRNRCLPTKFVSTNTAPSIYPPASPGTTTGGWPAFAPELSHVWFTHGSNTITWKSPFPFETGLAVHPGATAAAYIYPQILIGVDPADIPHMATWQLSPNTNALGFFGTPYSLALPDGSQNTTGYVYPGTNHFRFVGVNFTAAPGQISTWPVTSGWGNPAWSGYFQYPSPGSPDVEAATSPPPNHFHHDRCIIGMDSEDLPNFSHLKFGWIGAATHFSVRQCHGWGILAWDGTDNYVSAWLGGSNFLYEDNYLETGSETVIVGGAYISENWQPSDFTIRRNVSARLSCWQRNTFGSLLPGNQPPQVATARRMAFGQKVKNHWELKQGIRAAWHDNLNIGGWMTYNPSGGQAGNPFGAGTRDQNADQGSPYWKTCPWNAIMDLDIYNNLSIDCGVAFAFFSASSGDAQSCLRFERYRLRNNMHHCNPGSVMPGFNSSDPWPIPGLRLGSTQGMVTDVILDHNHFIINGGNPNIQYWNATTQLPAYPRILLTTGSQDPWTTITGDPRNSRFQITNNIFDTQSSTPGFGNNATFYNDPAIGTAGVYSSWTQIPVFVDVWITNNLRTQDNVQFVQTSLWQGPALYGAIGFSNWPGSPAIPPIPVSNWNVTTGTWVTTDTLPIGATLT